MASGKRCLYEVLGLSKDCSPDEVRSAYKRLALQRHPDKLVQSGVPHAEATAQFQELVHAYEVLSDPKERAWYDSHRSQILFSDLSSSSSSAGPNSIIPDLFSFFSNMVYSGYSDTGKGFYKVYADLFDKIYLNEINFVRRMGLRSDSVREAPIMGNLDSPYSQVTAFYNYWLGFCTVMDFCWVDQYDIMAGPNRKSRRVIEEENNKLRKKAKREYNEVVRRLAEFVKKRDKRVINMAMKRNEEMKKRKEEEKERKEQMEKEKLERLRNYEEPEWVKIQEEEDLYGFEEDDSVKKKKNEGKELYCVVCSKKFKSEKQWKNHEQSKKHKEKVAELRESIPDEEEDDDGQDEQDEFQEFDGNVDEVEERFKEGFEIGKQEESDGQSGVNVDKDCDEEDRFFDANGLHREENDVKEEEDSQTSFNGDHAHDEAYGFSDAKEITKAENGFEEEEEEEKEEEDENDVAPLLETMVFGRNKRINNPSSGDEAEALKSEIWNENGSEEPNFMEYDNRKSTRRDRRSRKGRSKKYGGGTMMDDLGENKDRDRDTSRNEDANYHKEESTSAASIGSDTKENNQTANRSLNKKNVAKKGSSTQHNNTSKGKKSKAASNISGTMCEKCGEEFDSRNKLHKHLADTGHATLKYR